MQRPSGGDAAWPRSWPRQKVSAARVIVHVFTRLRRRWPLAALRSGAFPAVWRPEKRTLCAYGLNLAADDEFVAQRERAQRVFDWDLAQARELARRDGKRPLVLDLFCCAGGVSEGIRRAGGTSVGLDIDDQPEFRRRFGDACFVRGDATDRALLRSIVGRFHPVAIWASPPCEASSTATFAKGFRSAAPRLIATMRELLAETGLPFVIENVRGSATQLSAHSLLLHGQDFGLRVNRCRLFEPGGGLALAHDPDLKAHGDDLRRRCCLGEKARWKKLDCFGRRMRAPCCRGNVLQVIGEGPTQSSVAENAAALGICADHMPYRRLAKAIPPAFAAFIHGAVVRHALRGRHGVAARSRAETAAP